MEEELVSEEEVSDFSQISLEMLALKMDKMVARLNRLKPLEKTPESLAQIYKTTQESLENFERFKRRIVEIEQKQQSQEQSETAGKVEELKQRVDTLEAKARRRNLHIIGLPLPSDIVASRTNHVEFVTTFLSETLKLELEFQLNILDVFLACRPRRDTQPSATLIVEFQHAFIGDKILYMFREASLKSPIVGGSAASRIMIFPDYSSSVAAARRAFKGAKQFAKEKALDYYLKFPANFVLIVNYQRKTFWSAGAAERFLKAL